jgi:hypothetical protein
MEANKTKVGKCEAQPKQHVFKKGLGQRVMA